MEFTVFIIIILVVVALALFEKGKAKRKEADKRKREIVQVALKAQQFCDKVMTLKTTTAKVNNCSKALGLMKQIEAYPECIEIIQNYDDLKTRLEAIWKVLPVIDYIEKAYKHRFKGKEKLELNSLQDALFEIRKNSISNADFEISQAYPEGTGEIVTIESVEERCVQLGWSPA